MRNRSNPGHSRYIAQDFGLYCTVQKHSKTGKKFTQRLSASTDLFFLLNSSHFIANCPSPKFTSPASLLTTRVMELVRGSKKRWAERRTIAIRLRANQQDQLAG